MKIKINCPVLLLSVVFLLFSSKNSYAQKWEWAKKGGTKFGNDYGLGIARDVQNNLIITGRVKLESAFGEDSSLVYQSPFGDRDIFVAKYDSSGAFLWVLRFGGAFSDYGYAVSTDAASNIYFTGYFTTKAYFGNDSLISNGNKDIVIGKINSSGILQWVRNIGGGGDDEGLSVSTDKNGVSYITGNFDSTMVCGASILHTQGGEDIFIAKFDASGTCLWGKDIGSSSTINESGNGIKVNSSGTAIYVTGSFVNTVHFGTVTLFTLAGHKNTFVVKYDRNGNCIWGKKAGSIQVNYGTSLELDKEDNLYVAGNYYQSANFGTSASPVVVPMSAGDQDIYIAKYDTLGNIKWAKRAGGGVNLDMCESITVNKFGNPVICGYFAGTCAFDTISRTVEGNSNDVYIAEYDTLCSILWLKSYKGISISGIYATGRGVITDDKENTFMAGGFLDTVNFDAITMIAGLPTSDIFIGKLSPYIKAKFSSDKTIACQGETINFVDLSRGMPGTWLWKFPGSTTPVSSAQNPVVFYNSSGNYNVQLLINNGFETDSILIPNYITINGCTIGITENQKNDIEIFPNPFNETSTIKLAGINLENAKVKFYNALEQDVNISCERSPGHIIITKGNLSAGMYFYEIITNNELLRKGKIIIY